MITRFTQRKYCGSRKGFTLVEVMVIIILIGIILLFAVPNFSSIQRRARIRAGAQEIGQDLRSVRERALASGQPYYAVKDGSNKAYHVYLPDGTQQTRELGSTTGGNLSFGVSTAGVAIPEDPDGLVGSFDFITGDTLWFEPRGSMSRGAIYLTDGKEDYAVGVTSLGMVRVYVWGKTGTWNKL